MFFLFSIKRDHWSGNSFQVAVALTRVVTVRARLMEKNVLQLMSWNKKTELIGYRWWVARNGARPRFRTAEFQTEEAAAAAGCAAAGAAALPRSRLLLRFLKISFQNGKKNILKIVVCTFFWHIPWISIYDPFPTSQIKLKQCSSNSCPSLDNLTLALLPYPIFL